MRIEALLDTIVDRLRQVSGVKAIVLGGSYATGTQRPDSDLDLGIHYVGTLDVEQIRKLAIELNDTSDPTVTGLGEWGAWVNGGAWLTIQGQRVDFLYRDTRFVSQVIDDCIHGIIQADYYQQPAYGFFSYMYCAEIQIAKVLYDPEKIIAALQAQVAVYPAKLKSTIVNTYLWNAEFTLIQCQKAVKRDQFFIVTGCLTRIASALVQVLYALNETYFLSEKRFSQQLQTFEIKPQNFQARLKTVFESIGTTQNLIESVAQIETLWQELRECCGDLYTPRFKF